MNLFSFLHKERLHNLHNINVHIFPATFRVMTVLVQNLLLQTFSNIY